MSAKIRTRFGLQIVLRLFVQYTISLSSLCKLTWRNWTYKMHVRYILSSVSVRLSIFSPLSIIQYMGLYVFSLPISLVVIERIYILFLIIIIKSEVWTITHCLGLGHETMVSAVWVLYSYIWVINNFIAYSTATYIRGLMRVLLSQDYLRIISSKSDYRKTSNIRRTLAGNKIVDHSDVVGASPVGAAPTTSSFST